MSSNPRRTKLKPLKESFDRTKKFFSTTFRNLKSWYQNVPKTTVFQDGKKLNSKLEKLENFYRSFSGQWESNEVEEQKEVQLSPTEQTKTECSKSSVSFADSSRLEDFNEEKEKKGVKYSARIKEEPSFLDAEALAKKMKELEMMDLHDMDHVLDIEEVLHYYSRLSCPAYLEIVDKFFTNMYSEFRLPQPSRSVNGSMRKLGSARLGSARMASPSFHGSMRSLGPIKV